LEQLYKEREQNKQGRDLIFYGIKEYENTRESIKRIISTLLGSEIHILRASRVGKKTLPLLALSLSGFKNTATN